MQIRNVTIIGGAGFVGRHLARVLTERGIEVTVATRNRERAKRELIVLPTVEVIETNVHADRGLEQVLAGADAVVNLVGILHESRRGDFARAHVELPQRIAACCKRLGIRRLVHMSALCADPNGPSAYLRSKGEGEARMLGDAGRGLDVTVFRPSIMFGSGDRFLGLFATLLRLMPVVLLGSPKARFQPVWVENVVRAFADSLDERATFGERYDLCGPTVYSLRELIAMTGAAIGHPRPIIGLGKTLSYLQALSLELSPVKLITRDNVRSMSVDNVCGCAWPAVFGFAPASLESILPTYLGASARREYDAFRARARR